MPNKHPSALCRRQQNSNHIKAIRLASAAVTVYPHPGRPHEFAPLPPVDGLDRAAKGLATAGLDLDKGDGPVPLCDQIEVAMTISKAALDHTPAVANEPSFGNALAGCTELLIVLTDCRRHGRQHGASAQKVRNRIFASGAESLRRRFHVAFRRLIDLVQALQHVARPGSIGRSEDTCVVELIDDARRSAVANLEPPL
jgi:hypothetical protein